MPSSQPTINTSIAPWFTIPSAYKAVAFYKAAFDAVETYRMEDPGGGLVVRLSVGGAEFWISGSADDNDNAEATPLVNEAVRMILTVSDPDTFFNKAINAGATQIYPVGEEHGWSLGRLADPFGMHWEVGYQLAEE